MRGKRANERSTRIKFCCWPTSSALVGSSSNSKRSWLSPRTLAAGLTANWFMARAMVTRCNSPPDSDNTPRDNR
ncbi:hypothetical protein D3C78_1882490 [compost metagenome]